MYSIQSTHQYEHPWLNLIPCPQRTTFCPDNVTSAAYTQPGPVSDPQAATPIQTLELQRIRSSQVENQKLRFSRCLKLAHPSAKPYCRCLAGPTGEYIRASGKRSLQRDSPRRDESGCIFFTSSARRQRPVERPKVKSAKKASARLEMNRREVRHMLY